MTHAVRHRSCFAFAAAAAILAAAAPLAAAPCETLPSPVYVSGSSLLTPLIRAMSAALVASPSPITVVFQATDSCTAASAFATTQSPLLTGNGLIWDYTGTQSTCELGAGFPSDVGISDLFPATCGKSLASNVSEQLGPVQALAFVVHKSSPSYAISRSAAYMVFGFGAQSSPQISPWNDAPNIFQLSTTSPTQRMLGLAIGVPATQWRPLGNAATSTSAMVNALWMSGNANAAIGILSTDAADTQRERVKELAYQDQEQTCAYWPDSSATSKDKQNVRDGHYPLWGRSHFFFRSSDSGSPLSASVAIVLDLISGNSSAGALNVVQLETASGLVPDCAMRVTRSAEMAPLESYMPASSCACYFSQLTGSPAASCTPCLTAAQCGGATPVCNFGYCEIK